MSDAPRGGPPARGDDAPRGGLSEFADREWSDVEDADYHNNDELARGHRDDLHGEGSAFASSKPDVDVHAAATRERHLDGGRGKPSSPAAAPPAAVPEREGEAAVAVHASPGATAPPAMHDGISRPPSPATLQAFGRLGAANASAFSPAALTSYEEYLANGAAQPVYGIPVACTTPMHHHHHHAAPYDPQPHGGGPNPVPYTFPPPQHAQQAVVVQEQQPPPPPPLPDMNLVEGDPCLEDIWRRRRNVLIYATADTFVVCVLIWSWIWVLALLPFPLIGLFAAWKYRQVLLRVYLSYFPVIVAVRAYVGYLQIVDEDPMRMQYPLIALCAIGGIAEIYIGYSVYHFRKALASAPEEAVVLLRQGWRPGAIPVGLPQPARNGFWG